MSNLSNNFRVKNIREKEKENQKYLLHFTTTDSFIKIALTNKFLLNSINNMNDINESLSFYDRDHMSEAIERFFWRTYESDIDFQCKNVDINKKEEILFKYKRQFFENREELIGPIIDEFREKIYIACFNELNLRDRTDNPLLWAHYGKGHTGLAILVDKYKLKKIFKKIQTGRMFTLSENIQYEKYEKILGNNGNAIDKIIDLNANIQDLEGTRQYLRDGISEKFYYHYKEYEYFSEQTIQEMILKEENECKEEIEKLKEKNRKLLENILRDKYLHKLEDWKYENEYRFIVANFNKNINEIFIEGINDAITGIIVGKRIASKDLELIDSINKHIFNNNLEVKMFGEENNDFYQKNMKLYTTIMNNECIKEKNIEKV